VIARIQKPFFPFQWRNLPKAEKEKFEERAKKIAEEQQAKQQEAERAFNESLQMYPPQSPGSSGYEQSMSPAASNRPLTPGSQYPSMPQQMQGQLSLAHSFQNKWGHILNLGIHGEFYENIQNGYKIFRQLKCLYEVMISIVAIGCLKGAYKDDHFMTHLTPDSI
jgi:hypothetical protein